MGKRLRALLEDTKQHVFSFGKLKLKALIYVLFSPLFCGTCFSITDVLNH